MEEKNKNKKSLILKKNKNLLITTGVVSVLLVIGIISYIVSVNNRVKAWENKIYPGISVYGVNLSGLNKDEAIA